MIGAEIAVSMIPPAAVVGIGLAFGRPDMALQSLTLLLINVVCLDILSSIPVLYFRGVRLEPLRIEKRIRDAAEKTVKDVAEEDEIFTEVILLSDKKAEVLVRLQTTGTHNDLVPLLARRISEEIKKETGFSNSVKVMIVPVSTYSSWKKESNHLSSYHILPYFHNFCLFEKGKKMEIIRMVGGLTWACFLKRFVEILRKE